MKRALLLSLILALFALAAHAEEQTLFNAGQTHVGVFGGPMVYFTTFKGDGNVLVGGQCGLMIDNKFYIGGFGAGIGHNPDAGHAMWNGTHHRTDFEMGYGGGLVGVVLQGNNVMHVAADVMVGGGAVSRRFDDSEWSHEGDWDSRTIGTDAFFVVQPMAHGEVNLVKWLRADLGAGYRFVSGVDQFGLTNEDLSGPVAGLALRFGKF